jgi:uncharacterized protein YjbI with pentapeptide repeats
VLSWPHSFGSHCTCHYDSQAEIVEKTDRSYSTSVCFESAWVWCRNELSWPLPGAAIFWGHRGPLGLEPPTPPKGGQRRTSTGPRLRAPAPPVSERRLPPIAAKADDLEAIKKAVDDAASVGGGLWLSYLFVLSYLAIAAGAVTHADLFLENPVKLPFFNIELPLLAFFFLAPIVFIVVHAYTLVHLVLLTDKAKRFDAVLRQQIDDENAAVRDSLRRQLPSNIFIQFLAGPRDVRASAFGWLLRAIAWITLVFAPVLLLLMMQLQFLPYHNIYITWTQRIAVLADLALLWWLWRAILSGPEMRGRFWPSWIRPVLGLALSACAILFSWTAATFPGEWQEVHLPKWDKYLLAISLHDWIFHSEVNPTTRHRWLPLSSTLVLTGLNIYEGLGIDDPKKAEWRDFVFRARGRDLKGARFDFASLSRVDFEGAQLQEASLKQTQLQGASLAGAQLQGASLDDAQLQGASLYGAQLQGASLTGAQLQGASLDDAQLQGASLDDAQLQGALMQSAQLQGASLDRAELLGASLSGAQLQGASLDRAELQGASLQEAALEAVDFSNTGLWRTNYRARWVVVAPDFDAPTMLIVDFAPAMLKFADAPDTWSPMWRDLAANRWIVNPKAIPWDAESYQNLRQKLDVLPLGNLRNQALDRIRGLDCSNPDTRLDSCDPSVPPPHEAAAWRKALEDSRVRDAAAYTEALVKTLKDLVCSGRDNAIYVLRGAGFQRRLGAGGAAAFKLVRGLTNRDSKDCTISATLTDADRTELLRIKCRVDAELAGGTASPFSCERALSP